MRKRLAALRTYSAALAGHLRDHLDDIFLCFGVGLLAYAAWLIYQPAGYGVVGLALIVGSVLVAPVNRRRR